MTASYHVISCELIVMLNVLRLSVAHTAISTLRWVCYL